MDPLFNDIFFYTFNALKKFVNVYNNRVVNRLKLRYNWTICCQFSKLGMKFSHTGRKNLLWIRVIYTLAARNILTDDRINPSSEIVFPILLQRKICTFKNANIFSYLSLHFLEKSVVSIIFNERKFIGTNIFPGTNVIAFNIIVSF